MTSPAALDILRRARLPFEARSTAVRGTHKATGAVFYLWTSAKTARHAAAVFIDGERDATCGPIFYATEAARTRQLSRAFASIKLLTDALDEQAVTR